ncbi:MAG: hypothetical protein K0S71_2564 [Clostridia bacterium]|nr:hypothetical protein [Clostridia bacterium]
MRLKHFLPLFCILFTLIYFIYSGIVEKQGYYKPLHSQVNLDPILSKSILEESDYKLIFEQTGIARPIVEELKTMPDFKQKVLGFQKNYLSAQIIGSADINFFTKEDVINDKDTNAIPGFELAPYHNGYIFLTKSTYTMSWRHGHAGIVIDAKRGKTLEALSPGTSSMEQDVNKWRYYPTFKMMRLKDVNQAKLDEIASYAYSNLQGIPYDIFADKNQGQAPNATHCSLLVWQAFKSFGFDLDATDGLLVSPANIASSPFLETLQIFGFNPDKDW